MIPTPQTLPGLAGLFSEIVSENAKKRPRGRPRKYDSAKVTRFLKSRLGEHKRTVRSQQNYANGRRAAEILLRYENGKLLLEYFLKRQTILAEIGRIPEETLLVRTATYIWWKHLKGEKARAEIRKARYGDRWPKTEILSSKVWKAVCEYRNLYPYMEAEKAKSDFDFVAEAISKCFPWKLK